MRDAREGEGARVLDAGRLLGAWLEARPEWLGPALGAVAVAAVVLAWTVAREERLDEDGRVRVRWHPPWRWPARVAARVAASRAAYPGRGRRALSRAWRALQWVRALVAWAVVALMLVSFGAGLDLARCPPCLDHAPNPVAVLFTVAMIAAAVMLSRGIARDDPFASDDAPEDAAGEGRGDASEDAGEGPVRVRNRPGG